MTDLPLPLFAALAALFGLFVGSFLNVVIYRLPVILEREWLAQAAEVRGESPPEQPPFNLAVPRSRCQQCGHLITALENVPILSYLVLRGRCRHCGTGISVRYPLVEALTSLLTALVAWHFGANAAALSAMIFVWFLIALTFIDFDTQLLPDSLTLLLLWLGLAANLFGLHTDLHSAVVGAMAGYLSLWSVYWLFKLATGKEGMGFGDFKLLAAIGAWVGWQNLPLTILLSSLIGAIVGILLIALARHDRNVHIPFGPYLAGAGFIALLYGNRLTGAYLGLF